MKLQDAPGGPEFINRLVGAIEDLSLCYAGTPDSRATPHLEGFLDSITPAVADAVGATKAPIILDAVRRATLTRKHELEAAGASRA